MNQKELALKRRQTWYKYHIPGQSNLHRRKINAIFLNPANSLGHELKKCEICYKILKKKGKFITEASENNGNRRVDVVSLDFGTEYEIETDKRRAERFKDMENVEVVMV